MVMLTDTLQDYICHADIAEENGDYDAAIQLHLDAFEKFQNHEDSMLWVPLVFNSKVLKDFTMGSGPDGI